MGQLLLQQIREELAKANLLKCIELQIQLIDSSMSNPGHEECYDRLSQKIDKIMDLTL